MEKYNSLSHRDKITQTVIVWWNKWWIYRLKPLIESIADSPSSSLGHPGRKSPVKTTRRSIQDTSKLIPAGLRQYCKTGLFSRQATWQLFFTLLDWCSFSGSYYNFISLNALMFSKYIIFSIILILSTTAAPLLRCPSHSKFSCPMTQDKWHLLSGKREGGVSAQLRRESATE